jgi:uncharacterized protein YdeI (YjbR/CyaY-like superfamily)
MPTPVKPRYFPSAASFRRWLGAHHAGETELWVGFHKKASGRTSLTWEESVDAALCFGWIDGLRKSVDPLRYVIRFSRRKARSIWSVRNIARVRELMRLKVMAPMGLAAFRKMDRRRSAVYSFEQRRRARFSPGQARRFQENAPAWHFFRAQAPSYRRVVTFWVVSAKKEETRRRRLERAIAVSARRRRLDAFGPAFPRDGRQVTTPGARARAPA